MDPVELRNLKDFLTLFNKLSEKCFQRCVYDLGQFMLNNNEAACVDRCILKHANVNHKLMTLFADINPQFQERKVKEHQAELEAAQTAAAAAAATAAASVTSPTPEQE